MPLLRVVHAQNEVLVIICDKELVGKTFRKKSMRLKVTESFYHGNEAGVEECLEALRGATIANLVGSIVKHAVKAEIIDRQCVMFFQKVPHAQLVKM